MIHAFTYKVQGNVKFDDLMQEAQRVLKEINTIREIKEAA